MSKPSSGSNRYLKAQLRPLTKPVFWASAGLFGLSLFALFSLFRQPDEVLSSGDRDAIVNLDDNDTLTPEERARAAEIDDLSVLLKDLDKSQTIDSVSGRLNDTQTTNLDAPDAIADLENRKPAISAASSGGNFQQLPLLDLSPQNQANNASSPSGNSGFVGFDPRSSGQVGGAQSSNTAAITPLAAALERNASPDSSAAVVNGSRDTIAEDNSSSINASTTTIGQATSVLSNDVQPNGNLTYTTPISTPTLETPNYGSSQGLTPQNSSNNAYSQILNPNLVVPTAPLSPTPTSPVLPVQPATPSVSSVGQTQSTNLYNSGAISEQASYGNAPTATTTTSSPQSQVFGAPSSPTPSPTISNPAPYSVPNATPGQYSGNGQINTFANP